jgi:hypothetical protein
MLAADRLASASREAGAGNIAGTEPQRAGQANARNCGFQVVTPSISDLHNLFAVSGIL